MQINDSSAKYFRILSVSILIDYAPRWIAICITHQLYITSPSQKIQTCIKGVDTNHVVRVTISYRHTCQGCDLMAIVISLLVWRYILVLDIIISQDFLNIILFIILPTSQY